MEQANIIRDLELRAEAIGIPMGELCRRAGVAPSTVSRWKSEKTPIGMTFKTLAKLQNAAAALEAESGASAAA